MYNPFERGYFHIVTVGRMTVEKGAMMAVAACEQICSRGYKIRWHWVGDGNQMDIIKEKIRECGVDNAFILEGNKENPYPYIKNADFFVLSSYMEGYGIVIKEALLLKTKVLTTDITGPKEILEDGKFGIIVPNDDESIKYKMKDILDNKEKYKKYDKILSEYKGDNEVIKKQTLNLLDI